MPLGLLLIIVGVLVGVFLSYGIGALLVIGGVILLLVPAFNART